MLRKIIKIDSEKCNGCGACARACHEGAIEMVDGKAKLTKENYCDGLGDCLPACPTDAISFEMREAPAYDEAAVLESKKAKVLGRVEVVGLNKSQLSQWPVQIKLAPLTAPYFNGADLLIAADCTAYAYGDFHNAFIKGRVTLIGCPKLDEGDYSEKLAMILANNDIKSITVTRMTVPCCGKLQHAVMTAIANCGKAIPCNIVTIDMQGNIVK